MRFRHQVEIDTKKVDSLIERAAESVSNELQDFFKTVGVLVKNNIHALVAQGC